MTSHWDNWLRANIHDFDCISPSMPRNRNFGSTGANMNKRAFLKEFANMQFYSGTEEVRFDALRIFSFFSTFFVSRSISEICRISAKRTMWVI